MIHPINLQLLWYHLQGVPELNDYSQHDFSQNNNYQFFNKNTSFHILFYGFSSLCFFHFSGGWWALSFRGMVGIEFQGDGRHFSGGWWELSFRGMVGIEFQGDGGHYISGELWALSLRGMVGIFQRGCGHFSGGLVDIFRGMVGIFQGVGAFFRRMVGIKFQEDCGHWVSGDGGHWVSEDGGHKVSEDGGP